MKVLLFSSPTCGPCKQLKAALKTMEVEADEEINIMEGSNLDTIKEYKIRGVPTMVLLNSEGVAVDVEVGFSGKLDRLRTFFKHKLEAEEKEHAD